MSSRRSRPSDLVWAAAVFIGVFSAAVAFLGGGPQVADGLAARPPAPPASLAEPGPVREVRHLLRPPPDQHFRGCDQVRAAGRENIPSHDPSYRAAMDGDGDGLACEPRR